jgi:hypothetical protein
VRVIGWIATILAAGLVASVLVLIGMSIPDIRRYLGMRRM